MVGHMNKFALGLGLLALTACGAEIGNEIDNNGNFGNATMNNTMVMSGELDYTISLGKRFADEYPTDPKALGRAISRANPRPLSTSAFRISTSCG